MYDHKPKIWELFNNDSAATIEMMNQTIAAYAAHGNVVILGRGGSRVLDGMADVLKVFVKASDRVRSERIAKRRGVDAAEAAELIKADDELHSRFVRLFYGADWTDESHFDLVIDTDTTSTPEAVAQIAAAATALPAATGDEHTAAALGVDAVLARTVAQVLARKAAKP
ncbi:MAG TPA: cytidylate kinase-like family protein [Propionicimonas sp.]